MADELKVLDLFAGAGGLSLGFKLAGFNVAGHVEIDRWAAETLRKNFKKSFVIEGDISKIDVQEITSKMGKVDIIIGGPPCQGFSLVGKGKLRSLGIAHDKRNSLYKQFVRFVYLLHPRAIVMENVPAILKHNKGTTAKRIVAHFEAMGYNVCKLLLNAADYGVPQTRKRAFFIGIRDDATSFIAPRETHAEGEGRLLPWITVAEAIADLPKVNAGSGFEKRKYNSDAATPYQLLMRHNSNSLFNHISRKHSEKDLEIFSVMSQGQKYHELPAKYKRYRDDAFKDKYKKLVETRPSWTVLAHLQKDGLMYIHPNQKRTITVREAARLQSFPDRFFFCGPMTQQFRQVGNAVPPLMAKAVALSLKRALQKSEKAVIEPLLQV